MGHACGGPELRQPKQVGVLVWAWCRWVSEFGLPIGGFPKFAGFTERKLVWLPVKGSQVFGSGFRGSVVSRM